MSFHVPEQYREANGVFGSDSTFENNGMFVIPIPEEFKHIGARQFKGTRTYKKLSTHYTAIVSDGAGWEHVSVSLAERCLTWGEMCFIKSLFWDAGDCVLQYHPPESEYVNDHEFTLHLWRPINCEVPTPPSILVGIKQGG